MIAIHALAMIFIMFYTMVAVLLTFQVKSRTLNDIYMPAVPVLIIGLMFSLLLNVNGVPFYEWLFPVVSIILIALFSKNDNLYKFNRWFMLIASVLLCLSHAMLTTIGYTSSPYNTYQVHSQIIENQKNAIQGRLVQLYPHNDELPRSPVSKLLDDGHRKTTISSVHIKKGWYTPITRLYSIQKQKKEIWYSGGKVNKGHLFLADIQATVWKIK